MDFLDGFGLGFIRGMLLLYGVLVYEEQGCGADWWLAAACVVWFCSYRRFSSLCEGC